MNLFTSRMSGDPDFDHQSCETYFRDTYVDPESGFIYSAPKYLKRLPTPTFLFGTSTPSKQLFDRLLFKSSNKSDRDPNGLQYIVYKNYSVVPRFCILLSVKF